jgi:hypothetical protein
MLAHHLLEAPVALAPHPLEVVAVAALPHGAEGKAHRSHRPVAWASKVPERVALSRVYYSSRKNENRKDIKFGLSPPWTLAIIGTECLKDTEAPLAIYANPPDTTSVAREMKSTRIYNPWPTLPRLLVLHLAGRLHP